MSEKKLKPRGREQVVAAVLQAAAELFAQDGIEAVSIRDIATRADVNHGLIHRHFGSKDNLRLKTQEYLAKNVRDDIGEPENIIDAIGRAEQAIREHPLFWKVMARTFLDGTFEGDVQGSFPFIKKMVDFVREAKEDGLIVSDMDPRYIVAAFSAYGLGIRLFEDYIMQGTGLDDEPVEEVRSKIKEFFLSVLFPTTQGTRSDKKETDKTP